jgi:hypothetical protein
MYGWNQFRDPEGNPRYPQREFLIGPIAAALLVLEMENGQAISPTLDDLKALQRAPDWTKPILEAALSGGPTRG